MVGVRGSDVPGHFSRFRDGSLMHLNALSARASIQYRQANVEILADGSYTVIPALRYQTAERCSSAIVRIVSLIMS